MESLNRRSALVLGVALAPAIGLSQSVAAASMYGPDAGKEICPASDRSASASGRSTLRRIGRQWSLTTSSPQAQGFRTR
jgi:hypothetical protein